MRLFRFVLNKFNIVNPDSPDTCDIGDFPFGKPRIVGLYSDCYIPSTIARLYR